MKLRFACPSFFSRLFGVGATGSRAATAAVCLFTMATASVPALAATDRPPVMTQQSGAAPRGGHDGSRRRLSKYEARKIRHACAARAGERKLAGPERDAFIANCVAYRLAHRGERQRCRQEAFARGLDKAALRDALRDCARDKSRD